MLNEYQTALHEAGHAVAHVRHNLIMSFVSIRPDEETFGRLSGEGADHVYDQEQARLQVIAFLSGYAALKAHGFSEADAIRGTDDDFDQAKRLIAEWNLPDFEQCQREAVEFMTSGENKTAAKRLADELIQRKHIDGALADVIVEIANLPDYHEQLENYIKRFPGLPLNL